MSSCNVCGSNQFEEENGFYFCTICQSQKSGHAKITQSDEAMSYFSLNEIKTKKLKIKKQLDLGPKWTTFEAYNIILEKQCCDLSSKLNLSQDFRQTLIGLWMTYLQVSEIAFVENQELPKLNHLSKYRDVQLIKYNYEQIKVPHRSHHQNKSKRIRRGNTVAIFDHLDNSNEDESDENENNEKESDQTENNEKESDENENNEKESDQNENNEKESDQNESDQKSDDNESKFSFSNYDFSQAKSKVKPSFQARVQKLKNFKKKRELVKAKLSQSGNIDLKLELDENSDSNDFEENLEDTEDQNFENIKNDEKQDFNFQCKRSQALTKVFGKDVHRLNITKDELTTHVPTLTKLISLIYLSLRILNEDIFINDLSIWIKQGHITFYDAINILPKNWVLSSFDRSMFVPKAHLTSKNVQRIVVHLMRLMKINQLPIPNFSNLLKRFVTDLNLPSQLGDICHNYLNLLKFEYFQDFFNVKSNLNSVLPFYERYVLLVLVISIKKLFGLDGQVEKKNSKLACDLDPNAFIWNDWEHQTSFWWKQIQTHYLPINTNLDETVFDAEVINDYYFQLCKFWRVPDSSFPKYKTYETESYRDALQTNIKLLESKNEKQKFLKLPSTSIYHFQTAIKFTKARLDDLNKSYLEMNQDFSSKSVQYLEDIRFVCNYWNWSLSHTQDLDLAFKTWPDSFKLLLEISCFILDCSFQDLYVIMKKIEDYVFPEHSARYRSR